MKVLRVKANFMDEGTESPQVMVFDVVLNDDDEIQKLHVFGYLTDDDYDKKKYPFIITFKGNVGNFDWGGYADDGLVTSTNILNKKIKEGEYFTRIDILDGIRDEYTYKIKEIIDLSKE